MTKVQAIRNFASVVASEHVTIARERDDWSISMADSKPRLILPHDLNQNDPEDKMFRANFVKRCPIARGFASVTLSILHELGHHFNREVVIFADKLVGDDMEEHLTLPHEVIATEWAINWLKDPINRKTAKAFEKEYRSAK